MKTAISVPDETFRRVEAQAAALNMNRSEFYSVAAERYLNELEATSLTSEINAAIDRADTGNDNPEMTQVGLKRLGELTINDQW